MNYINLIEKDKTIYDLMIQEKNRQNDHIELIASENFVSTAVLEAAGTVLTNKYAEGYPGKRYYGGCEIVDQIETIAIERAKQIFGADHANVQPHSGSNANLAVYFASIKPGDTVLGMNLSEGGHLTHGSPVNISGTYFNFVSYGVDKDTELIDYDKLYDIAQEKRPKLIIAGATAYPRTIDFSKYREIADSIGAYLMVDMAHIAGLVATGFHPNPVPYADFVTTTTHKTLRGPRGAMILCKEEHAKMIDKAVFPGVQGGPLEHVIAAKAVSFKEVMEPDFKLYCANIIKNATVLASELSQKGMRLVSGGTDNHLILLDVTSLGITGKEAQQILEDVHITTNKNTIPNDPRSPFVTSGIRIGTPAVTSRGMNENDMRIIAGLIYGALSKTLAKDFILDEIRTLTNRYPLYKNI